MIHILTVSLVIWMSDFFIVASVWGMSIHKLSSNVNRLYISKCHRSRTEKEALKWTGNELLYLKWNSCHLIRGYIFLIKCMYTCFTITPRVTVNISWRKPVVPGTSWKFEYKWGDQANERSSMFDASHFHENKCLSEIKQCFLNVM